jgi:hypothetical protein
MNPRLAILLGLLLLPLPARGATPSNLDQLRLVARGYQANLESIRTWQGKATIVDFRGDPGTTPAESSAVAEFAYDVRRHAVRWNYNVLRPQEAPGEGLYLQLSSQMTRDNEHFKFGPNWPDKQPGKWTMFVDAPKAGVRAKALTDEFDPMYFFQCVRKDLPLWLDAQCKFQADPKLAKEARYEIRRDGQRVVLHCPFGGGFNHFVFDLSSGCTVAEYDVEGRDVKARWTFNYEKVDGVFVPKTAKYRNVTTRRDKTQSFFERYFALHDQIVNEPIDDSAFTFEKMGLRPGDVVNDTLRGTTYQFGEAAGVTVGPFHSPVLWWFIGVNVVVLISIVATLIYRRTRQL